VLLALHLHFAKQVAKQAKYGRMSMKKKLKETPNGNNNKKSHIVSISQLMQYFKCRSKSGQHNIHLWQLVQVRPIRELWKVVFLHGAHKLRGSYAEPCLPF
jgi:hypothetical protein